jgi:dsRNA-specific ribonuclease
MSTTSVAPSKLFMKTSPKKGVNYNDTLIAQTIPEDEEKLFVTQLTKRLKKPIKNAIVLVPGLGTLIYQLLKGGKIEHVYTYAMGSNKKILANNLKQWELTDYVTINDKFSKADVETLLPESVVIMNVDSELEEDEIVSRLFKSLKKAALIAVRSVVELDPSIYGFVTDVYKDNKNQTSFYFLTVFVWDEKKQREWRKTLYAFLESFLPQFIDAKFVPKFLTPEALAMFETAFTTESINPDANSEMIELVGDRMLEICMTQYLRKRYPTITKGKLNQLKSVIVEKEYLSPLAIKLNMADKVATVKETKHVREDVIEAFIGSLVNISDALLPGLCYPVCQNFVNFVFNQVNLGSIEDLQEGPGITLVPQYFKRIGLGKKEMINQKWVTQEPVLIDQQKDPKTNMTVSTVYITKDIQRELSKMGIQLEETLGTGVDIDPKKSSKNAYQNAYEYIVSKGMTPSWVKKMVQRLFFSFPETAPYYKTALAKAKKMGYKDIELASSSAQRSFGSIVAQVLGIDKNGVKERLAIGVGATRNIAMGNAMKDFVSEDE